MTYDVIELTQKLISFPSVTPKDEGAQVYLAEKLEALGFECFPLPFGEGDEKVPNLFARIGSGAPHVCFAGHTDVVPTGPIDKWTHPPFDAHIENGVLYGRGASDMKGGIAAFLTAVSEYLENNTLKGSISFLITGDEEARAINGSVKVLEWIEKNGHVPDVCLVGEPSNPEHLGQFIKTGRRGSFNALFKIYGKSGHVAHPDMADNPIPKLFEAVSALNKHIFDEGAEHFQPTNLEFTSIAAGEFTDNIIPQSACAKLNIRFNDLWTKETIDDKIRNILDSTGFKYDLTHTCDANSTVTPPNGWTALVRKAIKEQTGKTAAYTTHGATSDARFIGQYCPTIEFGVTTQTIHQVDECVRIQDLITLKQIYKHIIETADNMDVKALNEPEPSV
jgi:succinyl-diaminopimelate desuccinylase